MSDEHDLTNAVSAQADAVLYPTDDKTSKKPTAGSIHTPAHRTIIPKHSQSARKQVKDSVFCHLFQDKRYLLQLYQALHPEDIEITEDSLTNITLDNVLMNGQYNDLGFLAGDRFMILAESQSVWSVNILIRALLYLMETYQIFLSENGADLYGSRRVHLPKPEIYVIFIGSRVSRPAEISLTQEFFAGEACAIEAKAKVIYEGLTLDENGKEDIIGQYIAFSKIYDEQRRLHGRTQKTIRETLRICSERDILREYLRICEKEVTSIMSFLFDKETIYRNHDNAMRKEYREKYTKQAQQEAARKMLLKRKLSVEEIAEYQNLTVEEVRELEAELLQNV
ncbi:MAG: hypothetical protein LUC95_12770 [Lachnospiraceae bacterium]|nr:hypothetical protein [Lachnospiraceae bacterium]